MDHEKQNIMRYQRRKKKVRSRIFGTAGCPRFSVFRSSKHLFLQLIDDASGRTLVSASSQELPIKKKTKSEKAFALGSLLAKKAREKSITNCVFDRGGRRYHGRVAKVAEGAREGGLII